MAVGQHPPEKQSTAHDRDEHRDADRIVVEPVPARTFVERVFEATERGRHQEHPGQVKIAQERQVGLVDIDRDPHHRGDCQAWDDVDQEEPMPGKSFRQKPAECRAQRRSQAEYYRDNRDDACQLPAAEFAIDDRPHRRRDRATEEPLDRPIDDHLAETGGGSAQHAGPREAQRGDNEQHAGRQQSRQEPAHRHHNDIGDQICGLDPGDFVGTGRQPALYLGQGTGDDLHVHDRQEQPGAHRQNADPVAQLWRIRSRSSGGRGRIDRCGSGRFPSG